MLTCEHLWGYAACRISSSAAILSSMVHGYDVSRNLKRLALVLQNLSGIWVRARSSVVST